MLDLRLDHEDDGVVAEAGVRAEQHEQVGEAGERRAEVRLRAPAARRRPACGRRGRARARRAAGRSTWKPVPKMIASTCALDAVAGDDRVRRAPRAIAVGDHLDVRLRAAPGSSRSTAGCACSRSCSRASALRAAPGPRPSASGDVRPRAGRSASLRGWRNSTTDQSRDSSRSAARIARCSGGRRRYSVAPPARNRRVGTRHHPRRRALEHVQPADLRLDLRDELDRRRARADHRDALAREVVLVVPPRGVEGPAPRTRSRPGRSGTTARSAARRR